MCEGCLSQFLRLTGKYIFSGAENRKMFRNLKYLVQLVRYKENSDTLLLQVTDHLEQVFHFFLGNSRSRLIHDNETGLIAQCPGQLNQLQLAGCTCAQGFYYDRPLPEAQFERKYLHKNEQNKHEESGKEERSEGGIPRERNK